jgi:hypothetical protein
LFGFALSLIAMHAHAELPEPQGPVLLSVSGLISETNIEDRAEFDRDMLQNIGMVDLRTETPWTEGKVNFSGVPVARVLDTVGTNGSMVRALAANDYRADIPIATLRDAGAILAMRMNNEDLSLRDKGPLWIIFPWTERPDLDRIEIHNYAVWQLLSIQVQ